MDSPNGEINVYLVLSNNEESASIKNDFSEDQIMVSPLSNHNMGFHNIIRNNISNTNEDVEMEVDNVNIIKHSDDIDSKIDNNGF